MTSLAIVELTSEIDERDGREYPCVYAACRVTGMIVGPVWGHGNKSVNRALAQMTEQTRGLRLARLRRQALAGSSL